VVGFSYAEELGRISRPSSRGEGRHSGFFAAVVAALVGLRRLNDLTMVVGRYGIRSATFRCRWILGRGDGGVRSISGESGGAYVLPAAVIAHSERPASDAVRWCLVMPAPAWCRRPWRFQCW